MKRPIKFLFIWIALWLLSLIVLPLLHKKAEAIEMPFEKQPIESIVGIYADMYGVDPNIGMAVLKCESKGKQSTVGDNGNAKGVFQYWDDTWKRHYREFYKLTGIELSKDSPADNARLAMWAFSTGKANEWTTYRAIKNGGTYSFYSRQLKKYFTVNCSI